MVRAKKKATQGNDATLKQSKKALRKSEEFLSSRWFLVALASYVFLTQAFGLDLVGFIGLALVFAYICFFGKNTNATVPILCLATFCVSTQNSPWKMASGFQIVGKCQFVVGDASTFYSSLPFLFTALIGGAVVLVAMIYRLAVYGNFKRAFQKKGVLWGIVFLSVSFLLSGAFSASWQAVGFAFGAIQGTTFFFVYLFFASTLDFEKFTLSKIADLMLTVMFYIMALLVYIYATRFYGFLILSVEWKRYMVSGWGMSNDFGIYLAVTMPACFYRIARSPKHKWIWIGAIVLANVGIFFTLCRAAMVAGAIIVLIGTIVGVRDKDMRARILLTLFWVIIGVGALLVALGLTGTFSFFFDFFIKKSEEDITSGRFELWGRFWEYFLQNPVFGGGFAVDLHNTKDIGNGVFGMYSALAHNIFFQALGGSGLFGLLAGVVHLLSVGRALVRYYERPRSFLVLASISFLCVSLLDAVFYKAFFTFLYLAILVASEADAYRKQREEVRSVPKYAWPSPSYKPRVVFPFVEAGMGHIMPQRSLVEAFERKYGAYCEVIKSQFFSETNEKSLLKFEKTLVNEVKKYNRSHVYGYLNMFAMDVFGPTVLSKMIMEAYIPEAGKSAIRHMQELQPDMVVNTHWATTYYAEQLPDKPITVSYIPDVQIIPLCRYKNDMTLVSTPRGYLQALKKHKRRFNGENLRLVPFAIRQEALRLSTDKKANRRALGLDENKLTVVLFEGGYGLGKMRKIVQLIAKSKMQINVVAICGKNEKLYNELKRIKPNAGVRLIVEGFCTKTLEYLAAANVWIGKSGASSIAEATYFGCATIVSKYATTMERDNAEYYLKDVKNALKIFNAKKVVKRLKKWTKNPEELRRLQKNARKVHGLYGSERTADVLWELLCERFSYLKNKKI